MSGSFYPLQNLDADKGSDDKVKVPEPPKAPVKKEPRRTPEEEEDYTELLHSLSERPIITDEELDEARFDEVIESALVLARKQKEWFSIWSNCAIRGNELTTK